MNPEKQRPLVSIILPTENNAGGLPAALESILRQTCPDFELIIVDDGSADTIPEHLARQADPRVIAIRHPERSGMARAWNTGISAARGAFIGFITGGDEWDGRKLEEQVAAFSRLSPECGVVCSDVLEVTPAGTRAYRHSPDMTGPDLLNSYATDYQAGSLGTGPLLVRRTALDRARPFDEQFRCFSDTDMIIRLQRTCRFHHIRKPLCISRSRQAPAADPFEQSVSRLLLMQKYPETLENPFFVAQQLEMIQRNLMRAREGSPGVSGPAAQEPEHGQYREPVPET
jgi:glycosyltransferase involved in cell wall biosynthesis